MQIPELTFFYNPPLISRNVWRTTSTQNAKSHTCLWLTRAYTVRERGKDNKQEYRGQKWLRESWRVPLTKDWRRRGRGWQEWDSLQRQHHQSSHKRKSQGREPGLELLQWTPEVTQLNSQHRGTGIDNESWLKAVSRTQSSCLLGYHISSSMQNSSFGIKSIHVHGMPGTTLYHFAGLQAPYYIGLCKVCWDQIWCSWAEPAREEGRSYFDSWEDGVGAMPQAPKESPDVSFF